VLGGHVRRQPFKSSDRIAIIKRGEVKSKSLRSLSTGKLACFNQRIDESRWLTS
jgi:hypothetical protein